MLWTTRPLRPGVVEHDPGCSWRAWATALIQDGAVREELTQRCSGLAGLFWECVPTSREHADAPFRFVTVHSRAVAALQPDRGPFQSHLDRAGGPVATFDNLGHDAVLVAPVGAVPGACAHLASWCRAAPEAEQHALWKAVGQAVEAWWERSSEPVWVSTSGLGVPWLHVRLDTRPKYVTHRPYRIHPGKLP